MLVVTPEPVHQIIFENTLIVSTKAEPVPFDTAILFGGI